MSKFLNKYRIESARLKYWNYSTPWWYYITVNTQDHKYYFGKVTNNKMVCNELGKIAELFWKQTPLHYKNVEIDYYILMPNHLHSILILNNVNTKGTSPQTTNQDSKLKKSTLGDIIGKYKAAVTREAKKIGVEEFKWQTRFYDRIIRNEKELYQIRKYIEQNPLKWDLEKNRTENLSFD